MAKESITSVTVACDFIQSLGVKQLPIKQILYKALPRAMFAIKMVKSSFLNPHSKRISLEYN